ncbi:MAG: hypothetical protein ABSD96_22685, partial [Candidatus Korobacteraceae bacterium]
RFFPLLKRNLHERVEFQQISVQNCGKDRYNLAERAFNRTDPEAMATICKHPRVRIVSRHEDTEYVECLECGEVFDSEEFRDMEIEESAETEDAAEDK